MVLVSHGYGTGTIPMLAWHGYDTYICWNGMVWLCYHVNDGMVMVQYLHKLAWYGYTVSYVCMTWHKSITIYSYIVSGISSYIHVDGYSKSRIDSELKGYIKNVKKGMKVSPGVHFKGGKPGSWIWKLVK